MMPGLDRVNDEDKSGAALLNGIEPLNSIQAL